MKQDILQKARRRLDERLLPLKPVERFMNPPKGWIRAIREALGMTGVQYARRLAVTPQSVEALEKSEANGTIKLETLRRAAEALDCTLVYALVPNASLEKTVHDRAKQLAMRDLLRVAHTMNLEKQGVHDPESGEDIEAMISEYIRNQNIWKQS